MKLRLLGVALLFFAGTACDTPSNEVSCVVRVYRPDGVLHREYHGSSWGGLPVVQNAKSGAAYVYLRDRTIDAAAGWQIEVDREAEKEVRDGQSH